MLTGKHVSYHQLVLTMQDVLQDGWLHKRQLLLLTLVAVTVAGQGSAWMLVAVSSSAACICHKDWQPPHQFSEMLAAVS